MNLRRPILALIAVALALRPCANAQSPCPVALLAAKPVRDGYDLQFRNNGKLPLEQISLACQPTGANKFPNGICHVESGIFYPSSVTSIRIDYLGAGRQPIEISVASLRLNGGSIWVPGAGNRCRTLRVPRGK